jgi:hypothetical protein
MLNWTARIEQYLQEGRTVSGGKGDSTIKGAEKQQLAFSQQLMQAFTTQFGKQSKTLDFLTSKLQPMIDNPTGLTPEAKASMTSQAINNTATEYQNALKATQARTAGQGGPTGLPSGVQAQISGQLAAAGAGTEADLLNQIEMQDQQLKNSNYWNAVNAENGVAAQQNPLGYAGGATSAGSAVGGLGTAFFNSKQGFGTSFMNSLGSTLGKTLGGANASPEGGFFGMGG